MFENADPFQVRRLKESMSDPCVESFVRQALERQFSQMLANKCVCHTESIRFILRVDWGSARKLINALRGVGLSASRFDDREFAIWSDSDHFAGSLSCRLEAGAWMFSAEVGFDTYETLDRNLELLKQAFSDGLIHSDVLRISTHAYNGQRVESFSLVDRLDDRFNPACYPFIEDPQSFVDQYKASDSSVLILIGEPGTGKTRFIRYIMSRLVEADRNNLSGGSVSAICTSSPKALAQDSIYSSFVQHAYKALIIEDADNFLAGRSDGNDQMGSMLNAADGIISVKGKKLILTTNLPNVSRIEEALTRKGRCFKVVKFRRLTSEEANAVAMSEIGERLDFPEDLTLAEVFERIAAFKTSQEETV